MALEFSGSKDNGMNGTGTYDHNLLMNRGLKDQHTIESITGLRELLNKKYEKPFSGIPKSDLSFDAATKYDLELFKQIEIGSLTEDFLALANEVYKARGAEKTLKEYIDTKVSFEYWSGTGGSGGSGGGQEVGYPLYEPYLATSAQRLFTLTKVYQVGTHQLEVYLNGLRMLEDSDYTEKDDHHVEFLFELEEDDMVLFMVRAVINSGLHEEFVANLHQTDFRLTKPYGIYQNILQVYRNGHLQRKGRDYIEVTDKQVRFVKPLKKEDLITFHQAGATDPLAGTIMESEIGRIKLNQAYTTMNVNEAIKIEQTDYIDMFVDVFLSSHQIDPVRSLTYLRKDGHIESDAVELLIDTTAEFKNGTSANTDVTTFKNQLRLKNGLGGTENNLFNSLGLIDTGTHFIEAISVVTPMEHIFHFTIDKEANKSVLKVIVKNQNTELATAALAETTGIFMGLTAISDKEGRVHLAYSEIGITGDASKVHYRCLNSLGMTDSTQVISDTDFDAYSPTIAIDSLDAVHIAFASNRLKEAVTNIDYVVVKDGLLSGIQHITINDVKNANYPSLVTGLTDEIHLVFEEAQNIKYVKIKERLIVHTQDVTADAFENAYPRVAIDQLNRVHIVWCSKRLSLYRGLDYCTLSDSYIPSSRKSIMEGTNSISIGQPRIAIDYENIAHIVTHGNAKQADYTSILYSYVYPDGSNMPYKVIADVYESSLTEPCVATIGDLLLIATHSSNSSYAITKTIANYDSMGQYTITLDSRSNETSWKTIYIDGVISLNTSVSTRYRLSDDGIAWSSWRTEDMLAKETTTGRYMQLQLTLATTNRKETPKVSGISVVCEPLWTEIYSIPKASAKEITSVIIAARYIGDVEFFVSRDGGAHFVEAIVEQAVNLTATPSGQTLVLKVRIKKDAQLHAWGMVW